MKKQTLGWILVVVNTLFTSAFVLTRVLSKSSGKIKYSIPAVILIAEILKTFFSIFLYIFTTIFSKFSDFNLMKFDKEMQIESDIELYIPRSQNITSFYKKYFEEGFSYFLPALSFAISNNLQYYALLFLDGSTFQSLFNTRIIITAVLLNIMLKKRITNIQYAVIISLSCSIALARWNEDSTFDISLQLFWGFIIVMGAVSSNSFASVYLEIKIKNNFNTSIHYQNLCISIFGVVVNLIFYIIREIITRSWSKWHLFHDFNVYTILSLLCMMIVGITVNGIIKYLDNISLIFSNSMSVIVVTIFSFLFMDGTLSINFFLSTLCILMSVFIYANEEKKQRIEDKYLAVQITPNQ